MPCLKSSFATSQCTAVHFEFWFVSRAIMLVFVVVVRLSVIVITSLDFALFFLSLYSLFSVKVSSKFYVFMY